MPESAVAASGPDRLLLDLVDSLGPEARHLPAAVVGDETGALVAGLLERGPGPVRVHTDRLDHERSIRALELPVIWRPLGRELFEGVGLVLHRLARPLEALEEVAWHAARWGDPGVLMLAATRDKHLNRSMTAELQRHFERVRASRGAYKSRALQASGPRHRHDVAASPPRVPRRNRAVLRPDGLTALPVELRAHGLTFGAARVDPGTRLLLETVLARAETTAALRSADAVVDLGCGNGTVSATLGLWAAREDLDLTVEASDTSASAVHSTRATVEATGVADRVRLARDLGLSRLADGSRSLVLLNPPFHDGGALTGDIAVELFTDAGRVLAPGGRLWCVWNSPLRYRPALERGVGPSRQLARDRRFTVTESVRQP